jgi:hypothetical protein
MGLSFVGNPTPRHAYNKCAPSLPKDHSWHILVAHATMSISYQIYTMIYQIYMMIYHKYHPKVGMKVIIVAP